MHLPWLNRYLSVSPWRIAHFAGIVAICTVALFPLYWMFVISMLTDEIIFSSTIVFVPLDGSFENYRKLLFETDFPWWLLNSTMVAGSSTILALIFGIPGGYALSRFRYPGKHILAFGILSTQMMPTLILIIPLFRIFVDLGLFDTLWALVLGNLAFSLPIVIWLMKTVFDSIPVEIEEAARIDGASWLTALVRVTLPVALPGLAATAIYSFLDAWDEFLLARTLIDSPENWVATLGVANYIGQSLTQWSEMMAAAFIYTLPPLVLFLLIQKHFVAGLGAGAVKG